MAFSKTLCAYCNQAIGSEEHDFCLRRLQVGTPADRRDPWVAHSIRAIKKAVKKLAKNRKMCPVCGNLFTRKGTYCSNSCTGKAYRNRAAGLPVNHGGAPRMKQKRVVAA